MFLTQRDGLGRDDEMVRMRRRPIYMTLIGAAAIIVCLLGTFLLLREGRGSLLVTVDQPGAVVMLNGAAMPTPPGILIKGLRADTYSVTVSKPGFSPIPASQILDLKSGETAKLSFSLRAEAPAPQMAVVEPSRDPSRKTAAALTEPQRPRETVAAKKAEPESKTAYQPPLAREPETPAPSAPAHEPKSTLFITTQPNRGAIYVDDVFKGNGSVKLTDLKSGEVVVRFGELEGYKTPESQKVFVSSDEPGTQVNAIYLPLIFVSAALDASGKVITQKSALNTGYVMGEDPPHLDAVTGPEVKYLEETHGFAWEMGYAFSNRNPPGQDFIEMTVDLPDHFDGVKPLELRLYGYGSDKHYPFTAGGRTGFDVIVNGREVRRDVAPASQLGKSGTGFDAIPINNYLNPGKNLVRLQTSASSHCYYYLYKIVLM